MHLREGTVEDLPYIADISTEALWNDNLVNFLAPYRAVYPHSHRYTALVRIKQRFYGGDRLIVAVTDVDNAERSEIITGFAFWSDTRGTSQPDVLPSSIFGNGGFKKLR